MRNILFFFGVIVFVTTFSGCSTTVRTDSGHGVTAGVHDTGHGVKADMHTR